MRHTYWIQQCQAGLCQGYPTRVQGMTCSNHKSFVTPGGAFFVTENYGNKFTWHYNDQSMKECCIVQCTYTVYVYCTMYIIIFYSYQTIGWLSMIILNSYSPVSQFSPVTPVSHWHTPLTHSPLSLQPLRSWHETLQWAIAGQLTWQRQNDASHGCPRRF